MTDDAPIPPGVEIFSSGCADRYVGFERGDLRACSCPEGRCWVTYAREQHRNNLPALSFKEWKRGGS